MHACFLISVDLAGLPSVFLTNHGQSRTKCTGGIHTNFVCNLLSQFLCFGFESTRREHGSSCSQKGKVLLTGVVGEISHFAAYCARFSSWRTLTVEKSMR